MYQPDPPEIERPPQPVSVKNGGIAAFYCYATGKSSFSSNFPTFYYFYLLLLLTFNFPNFYFSYILLVPLSTFTFPLCFTLFLFFDGLHPNFLLPIHLYDIDVQQATLLLTSSGRRMGRSCATLTQGKKTNSK